MLLRCWNLTADIAKAPKRYSFITEEESRRGISSLETGALYFRFDSWEKPALLVFFLNVMSFKIVYPWVKNQ